MFQKIFDSFLVKNHFNGATFAMKLVIAIIAFLFRWSNDFDTFKPWWEEEKVKNGKSGFPVL